MPVRGNCPYCVAPYELDDAFFKRAAGKRARCDRCGQFFQLPAANNDPKTSPVLSYQTPASIALPADCWQEEKYLVIRDLGATPDRCVKCNAPADGFWVRKKFSSQSSGAGVRGGSDIFSAILALIGLFIFMIEFAARKSVHVRIALCKSHRERRRRQSCVAIGVMLLGFAIGAGGMTIIIKQPHSTNPDGWVGIPIFLVGVVVFIGGIIWASLVRQVLGYHAVRDQKVWLKWAGKPFLDSLRKH